MNNSTLPPVIVIVGDVSIDWFWFPFPKNDKSGTWHWQSQECVESVVLHGGAWNLDNFVRMLLGFLGRKFGTLMMTWICGSRFPNRG